MVLKLLFMLPNVGHQEIAGSSPALGVAAFSPSLVNHHWLFVKNGLLAFHLGGKQILIKHYKV